MSINENDVFVCDFCGEDVGKFNQETGNHPQCEELSALRERVEALEAAARDEQKALRKLVSLVRCPDCGKHKGLLYTHLDFCYYLKADDNLTAALQAP